MVGFDSICFTEQLTFLKYLNERYLFYTITLFTFTSLFALVWILQKYTFFEKVRVPRASRPSFPYGNFTDVFKKHTSLHVYLWKYYNKFKRKGCRYGGLYVFLKPVVLLVESSIYAPINEDVDSFENLFPSDSKLTNKAVQDIINTKVLSTFIEKYSYSIQGAMPEKLLKSDFSSVSRSFLLESCCALFGFHAYEITDELNQLLKEKYELSWKFYLGLCAPMLRSKSRLNQELRDVFMDVIASRKKNDSDKLDMIEAFTGLYCTETALSLDDLSREIFNLFADVLVFSGTSLTMCLYELAENQEIQDELAGEIRRFNKKYRNFTLENLKELTYVEAVVKETFRKYPPVATIIRLNKAKNNATMEWYPDKRAVIFQSVLGIHRDPKLYVKPEAFDPDRFTDTKRYGKEIYLPFGVGPFSNLCRTLTELQVTLMLLSIFSSLEVKLTKDSTFKYKPGVLHLCPTDEMNFQFVRL